MPLTPGTSELVTIPAAQAVGGVKSITLNPFGPVEAGRPTPAGGVKLRASAGSSISGTTTA